MSENDSKVDTNREIEIQLAARVNQGTVRIAYGILISALLAAVKIISGLLGNSYALIADGVESMLDIVSSLAVFTSLKIASQPPDEKFPYGYGKVEPLATLVVSVALFVASAGIAIQSVREILSPHHTPAPFTLAVLIAVVITKELMFRFLLKTGDAVGSSAIEADAWHHRSDALTSLAAFLGISIALVGGEGYESADDWAALFACGLIAFNGFRLLKKGLKGVMDAAPPASVEQQVREIGEGVKGVEYIEKCRIRKSGLVFFVDIHVTVDGDISVQQGHDIAHSVKSALLKADLDIQDATVHIEPAE
jgi:cation diffusion facilitator family transporter